MFLGQQETSGIILYNRTIVRFPKMACLFGTMWDGDKKGLATATISAKRRCEIINLVQYPKKCTISFANNNTFFVCQWLFRIIQQYLPVFSQKSKYVSNFCSFRCLRTYYLYNTYKTVRVRYAFVSLPFQSTFLRNYVMCTAERRVVKL